MKLIETPLTWGLAIGLMISLFVGNLMTEDEEVFDASSDEICKLLNLTPEQCQLFINEGDISTNLNTDNTISDIFKKNCETVISYETAFCQENIEYEKFYSDKAIVKGTILGEKDSMYVADRKVAHQELWQKYDFSMTPLNPLPGVNSETKKIDGSVRNYFDITITLTENGKSITIPMYNSFDFDDDGKILFLQYYGDFTAAFLSLEE